MELSGERDSAVTDPGDMTEGRELGRARPPSRLQLAPLPPLRRGRLTLRGIISLKKIITARNHLFERLFAMDQDATVDDFQKLSLEAVGDLS